MRRGTSPALFERRAVKLVGLLCLSLLAVGFLLTRGSEDQPLTLAPPPVPQPPGPAPPVPAAQHPAAAHLRTEGARFLLADGQPFQWRGISAFRLLDFIADGDEAQARTYMAWARDQKLTVVRVFAMGASFMTLEPAAGRASLDRLLALAAQHNLHVEVVALADTRTLAVDAAEQVAALGTILGAHSNGLLEIANEPAHPTQAAELADPAVLQALAARAPAAVPIALGSLEADERFAGGDYATWHAPRSNQRDGWDHVLGLARGAELGRKLKIPVVSDEPIGAGPAYVPGRRDDSPARFRAAALMTRLAGLGATFHYEAGLQTRIPAGRELECLAAWNEAWALLPADVEVQGEFAGSGSADSVVLSFDRTTSFGVFERIAGSRGWVLAVGPGDPALQLAPGWTVSGTKAFEGVRLATVARLEPPRTSP
jgi:hypothetical protein